MPPPAHASTSPPPRPNRDGAPPLSRTPKRPSLARSPTSPGPGRGRGGRQGGGRGRVGGAHTDPPPLAGGRAHRRRRERVVHGDVHQPRTVHIGRFEPALLPVQPPGVGEPA